MDEVEAIERATLAAVPPRRLRAWDGWLAGLDEGTVGRAHSAVPLRHEAPAHDSLARVEAAYADAGLPPVLRLPDLPAFEALQAQLRGRGHAPAKPTLVQVLSPDRAGHEPAPAGPVEIASRPDAGWEALFLGEGFDPVDGACRLAILRRGRDSVFAAVRSGTATVAVGAAVFAHGWCGIHGMRTAPAARRQGLAGTLVLALLREARARGVARAFLQVEQGNEAAQSVYARLGFSTAWRYRYWRRA